MGLDRELLRTIVDRVLAEVDAQRLILFGSAATGTMTVDSDIDLLVILRSSENTRRDSLRVRLALSGLGHAFDIVVMTAERFEETKNVIGAIAFPAHKYGKVLYEAA
jgi:predicted nucleotidyltransferase